MTTPTPIENKVNEILRAAMNFKVHSDFGSPMISSPEMTHQEAMKAIIDIISQETIKAHRITTTLTTIGDGSIHIERSWENGDTYIEMSETQKAIDDSLDKLILDVLENAHNNRNSLRVKKRTYELVCSLIAQETIKALELVDDKLYDINSTEWGIPTKWSKEKYGKENYADLWSPNEAIHEVLKGFINNLKENI